MAFGGRVGDKSNCKVIVMLSTQPLVPSPLADELVCAPASMSASSRRFMVWNITWLWLFVTQATSVIESLREFGFTDLQRVVSPTLRYLILHPSSVDTQKQLPYLIVRDSIRQHSRLIHVPECKITLYRGSTSVLVSPLDYIEYIHTTVVEGAKVVTMGESNSAAGSRLPGVLDAAKLIRDEGGLF